MNDTRRTWSSPVAIVILLGVGATGVFFAGRATSEEQSRAWAREEVEKRERELTTMLFEYSVVTTMFELTGEGGMLLDELAEEIFAWGGYAPMPD